MTVPQHQQGAWILLSALGSRGKMKSDDLLLRLVREASRTDGVSCSSLVPLNLPELSHTVGVRGWSVELLAVRV